MGSKYTVMAYARQGDGSYKYIEYHRGESLVIAIWRLFAGKREGYGCMKLELR